ncbi:MAG: hypothetical protein ACI87A_003130 [Planctomycetota bacterium]|jgi:hypothetical protein
MISAVLATILTLTIGVGDEEQKAPEVYTTLADGEPLFRKPVQTLGIHGRLAKGTKLTVVSERGTWKQVKDEKHSGWIKGPKKNKLVGKPVDAVYLRSRAVANVSSGLVTKGLSKKYASSHGVADEQANELERTFTTPKFDLATYEQFVSVGSLTYSEPGGETTPAKQAEQDRGNVPERRPNPFGSNPFGEDDTLGEMQASIALKKLSKAIADDEHYFAHNVTYAEEEELGRGIANRLAAGKVLNNPALSAYVSMIGSVLVEHSDRTDIPYLFTILNSEEINAFAAPGGYIFITTGAIRACSDEAELAAVIGHEIAHIARRHGLRTLDQKRLQISKKMMGRELNRVTEKYFGPMEPDQAALVRELQSLANEVFENVTAGWNHEFELEADEFGMRYLARAGWDHRGMTRFLEVLHSMEGPSIGTAWSSHPPATERINRLKSITRSSEWNSRSNAQTERFQKHRALLQ